jgi:hypothetical protein
VLFGGEREVLNIDLRLTRRVRRNLVRRTLFGEVLPDPAQLQKPDVDGQAAIDAHPGTLFPMKFDHPAKGVQLLWRRVAVKVLFMLTQWVKKKSVFVGAHLDPYSSVAREQGRPTAVSRVRIVRPSLITRFNGPPARPSPVYGAYTLNPFLVRVEPVPMLIREQRQVAVIQSYVGLPPRDTSGAEFKFGTLLWPGQCGIWQEPPRTANHPISPFRTKAERVPVVQHLDAEIETIPAKSPEGFVFRIDLQVQIQLPDTRAPSMISTVGTTNNLVDEVFHAGHQLD